MVEQSEAVAPTTTSRPPVKTGKMESVTERINRIYEAIARRAYELFESEGRNDGNDVRHWLEAEKEFLRPMDVHVEETGEEFVVHAEVPGFTATDLEVHVEPRRVTITGKRELKQETKEGEALYAEQSTNEIFRAIELPSEVNATGVSATLKDGVMDIQIPKAETGKPAAVEPQSA